MQFPNRKLLKKYNRELNLFRQSLQLSQIQLLAMYVGEIQTIVNCQIRVFFNSDPQFISLAEIILQNRIFEWDRPVDR